VADGFVGQAVCLVPGGRGPVQVLHPVGLLLLQADAEQVGEQVMVAPPAPHLVQRHQEQASALGLLQQLLTVGPAGDRGTQRPRQALQDRGLQQEPPQVLRLAVQHLLGQVVQHIAVAAGERLHKGADVVLAPQRQGGQLQPGGPAFGPVRQRRHGRLGQLGLHRRPEQRGGFLGGEAQVRLAQLDELPAGPEAGQRQRRVGAAGQHQPQLRWQALQQDGQAVVDRWRLDQVIVVQDQHERFGSLDQLVDQHRQHRLQRRLGALKQGIDPLTDPGSHPIQGGGDIAPEPRRVAVAAVQRQPGHRLLAAPGPVAQQAGLAEAGRRAHQGEFEGRALGEALQQPWAGQEAGSWAGGVQLGCQQAVPLGRRRGRLSHGNSHARVIRRALPWRPIVVGGGSRTGQRPDPQDPTSTPPLGDAAAGRWSQDRPSTHVDGVGGGR
jgi:hypothetical protein